jgi:hypothetical protein
MRCNICAKSVEGGGKIILVAGNRFGPFCKACVTPETKLNNEIILFPGNPGVRAALPAEYLCSVPSSEIVGIDEAIVLSGKAKATIRNRLSARDPLLLAARLPGKGYRFNRTRFMKWVESCPEYATLPGVRGSKRG